MLALRFPHAHAHFPALAHACYNENAYFEVHTPIFINTSIRLCTFIERVHCRNWSLTRSTDTEATKNKIDMVQKGQRMHIWRCVQDRNYKIKCANVEDNIDNRRVSWINTLEFEKLNILQARLNTQYTSRLRSCCRQVVAHLSGGRGHDLKCGRDVLVKDRLSWGWRLLYVLTSMHA